ncbi:hypothetical protein DL769_010923 [Monosporascus sp. CRB-8-3]|nr:hypothetical protein DL769_010923 [Monosporascus sp. CRB-8-3]
MADHSYNRHPIPSNDTNRDHVPATYPAEMRTCQGGSVAAKSTSHVGNYPGESRDYLGSSGKCGSAIPLGVPSSCGSSTDHTESTSDVVSLASDTTTTTGMPIHYPTKRPDESAARVIRSASPSPREARHDRGGDDAPEALWSGKGDDGKGGDDDGRGRDKVLIPEAGDDSIYFFAYGRYFDRDQMKRALPEAAHVGLARVNGYRWLLCGPRRDEGQT